MFQKLPNIAFVNVADQAGIHFKHFGGKRANQLPEDMDSGAAWFDYNRDGWQDLCIAGVFRFGHIFVEKAYQAPYEAVKKQKITNIIFINKICIYL